MSKINEELLAEPTDSDAEKREATEALRIAALEDGHTIKPSDVWKTNPELWRTATDDERRNMLCGMVLFDGVLTNKKGLALLAGIFKVKVKDIEPYLDDMRVADAVRCLKITHNQFQFFLINNHQPMGKFFIGKQFAYQVNDPAHEGVDSVADRPVKVEFVSVATDKNDPDRKAMEDALERRLASVTKLQVVPKKNE